MAKSDYRHASHIDRVLKASGSKYAARAVLMEACRRADFRKPETTFTKSQLMEILGYSVNTIKSALVDLRSEGSLLPIRNFKGGKGNAVTYRICIVGGSKALDEKEDTDTTNRDGDNPTLSDRQKSLIHYRCDTYAEAKDILSDYAADKITLHDLVARGLLKSDEV